MTISGIDKFDMLVILPLEDIAEMLPETRGPKMLDQVEKNDKKLSGYEKTSEINNGKKERKKLTREEKQK